MNKNLLDFIQKLSNKDPKTLMQKTLKTTEECGELAKAVLPFLDSPQSNHKFSDTNKILEESCDVILCALSVAYNLGVSTEQIESMLWKKSEYWASLQDRESNVVFPIPFEVHVTIDNSSNLELFNKVCIENSIKPICLELVMQDGSVVIDEVMTSSKFYGTNSEVYNEICRIKNLLITNGFNVVREKIETVFWHPSAPSLVSGNKKMHKNGYFECHIELFLNPEQERLIFNHSFSSKVVVSKNNKKQSDTGSVVMLTLRNYSCYLEEFKLEVKKVVSEIEALNLLIIEKPLIEFSLYDTNVSHDKQWIDND